MRRIIILTVLIAWSGFGNLLLADDSGAGLQIEDSQIADAQIADSQIADAMFGGGGSGRTLALAELETMLAKDGRALSGASYAELEHLMPSPGGVAANLWNSAYVFRIGESTFIVDMRLITVVLLTSLGVVLLLFSPLGFMLFRGGAHALIGGVLTAFRIAPEFGEHLRREPKKWIRKEESSRRAFRAYMRHSFIPDYRNNVTAVAFLGTAFLILTIGLRGIKFMVPHQPDLIIMAIAVEITVLCMLGLTTWYERSEQLQSAETVETVRLPNGQYIDKEYVLQALRGVVEDLNASSAAEQGTS